MRQAFERSKTDPSDVIGVVVFWLVFLVGLQLAFGIWGPAALDQLQVAPAIVRGLFYALVLVVGSAVVAFGVGGIPIARRYLERWSGPLEATAKDVKSEVQQKGTKADPTAPLPRNGRGPADVPERYDPEPNTRLAIYLNDHLAGSVAAAELAARCASENRDRAEVSEALTAFRRDLASERAFLEQLIGSLGVRRSAAKVALAWSAEKLSRLKLNGELLTYSPLSRLVEFEALIAGVRLKEALWQSLIQIDLEGVDEATLNELVGNARRQAGELEPARKACVVEAIG